MYMCTLQAPRGATTTTSTAPPPSKTTMAALLDALPLLAIPFLPPPVAALVALSYLATPVRACPSSSAPSAAASCPVRDCRRHVPALCRTEFPHDAIAAAVWGHRSLTYRDTVGWWHTINATARTQLQRREYHDGELY
jgi:hypothetical protein